MPARIELLLNRTVENLGIVGDVVKVKPGFARNYLLPHRIAEHPTPEKIEALKEARAKAQAELAKLRTEREALIERLEGVTIKLVRSCNDQGLLYGAVSQRDIADQLVADGYGVDTRAVRLSNPIRRVGTYHCVIQFDRDLRSEIHIDVLPDRAIEAFTQQQAAAEAQKEGEAESSAEGADTATESESGAEAAAGGGAKKSRATGDAGDKPGAEERPTRGGKGAGKAGETAATETTRSGKAKGKGESSARADR